MRPATGESFPLGELRKLLSIYIEECNLKAPSFSSSIIFFIRPMYTRNKSEKGIKKAKRSTHVNLYFLHLNVCINEEPTIKAVL